ncbi:MAG: hypothetical protein Q8933_15955 [Bacteroidota bacterium]|nr:hypothetical protein [Bacteroidota bacterium]MDP4196573.1 hypothetical protein [Bacteroidota bacterium]
MKERIHRDNRFSQQNTKREGTIDGKLLEESAIKELGQFYWRKDFWREEI